MKEKKALDEEIGLKEQAKGGFRNYFSELFRQESPRSGARRLLSTRTRDKSKVLTMPWADGTVQPIPNQSL